MKVGNFEKKLMNEFGIKSQIAGKNDTYLCKNELTLAAAKKVDEKYMSKKNDKVDRVMLSEKPDFSQIPVELNGISKNSISQVGSNKVPEWIEGLCSPINGPQKFDGNIIEARVAILSQKISSDPVEEISLWSSNEILFVDKGGEEIESDCIAFDIFSYESNEEFFITITAHILNRIVSLKANDVDAVQEIVGNALLAVVTDDEDIAADLAHTITYPSDSIEELQAFEKGDQYGYYYFKVGQGDQLFDVPLDKIKGSFFVDIVSSECAPIEINDSGEIEFTGNDLNDFRDTNSQLIALVNKEFDK